MLLKAHLIECYEKTIFSYQSVLGKNNSALPSRPQTLYLVQFDAFYTKKKRIMDSSKNYVV